jgi:hypothetical protein
MLSLVALTHFFDLLELDLPAEEELVPPHPGLVAEVAEVVPPLHWLGLIVVVVFHPVEQVLLFE